MKPEEGQESDKERDENEFEEREDDGDECNFHFSRILCQDCRSMTFSCSEPTTKHRREVLAPLLRADANWNRDEAGGKTGEAKGIDDDCDRLGAEFG